MTDIHKALMTVLDYLADDNGELEGYTEYCDVIGSKEDHHVMKYVIEIWQEMATKADGELKEYAIDRLKDVEQAFQEVRRRSLVEYSFHLRHFLFQKVGSIDRGRQRKFGEENQTLRRTRRATQVEHDSPEEATSPIILDGNTPSLNPLLLQAASRRQKFFGRGRTRPRGMSRARGRPWGRRAECPLRN